MARRKKRHSPPLHPSVREALGYNASQTDDEIYADWDERISRVCKPCWELKYCPYGPLVEQSPLLPTLRKDADEQNRYFQECLENDVVGSVQPLTDEMRRSYDE
jgi:hypothetical protein